MGSAKPLAASQERPAMPRTYDDPDEDEGEGDDYDAETDYDPDDSETYPAGLYVDDERALVPCPHCRAEIDEESEQCPKCGMYLTKEDAPRERKSGAWIVLMVLALFAALIWMLGR
jgi:predicted nucleic acid-binding Zn ribbon protein